VRVCVQSSLTEVDDRIATAVERVARALEDAGHTVKPAPPLDGSLDEFLPIFGRLAANVPILSEASVQPITKWLRGIGKQISGAEAKALNETLAAKVLEWFGDADLVVTPTVARTAPRVREFDDPDPERSFRAAARIGSFTAPFNVSGQPAASIPAGVTDDDGLPIGVQIVGRRGEDAAVFGVARELERESDAWSRARAPRS
jgi:amidase